MAFLVHLFFPVEPVLKVGLKSMFPYRHSTIFRGIFLSIKLYSFVEKVIHQSKIISGKGKKDSWKSIRRVQNISGTDKKDS